MQRVDSLENPHSAYSKTFSGTVQSLPPDTGSSCSCGVEIPSFCLSSLAPTALAKTEEGCSPWIRKVQIPLPTLCPPHACHVQGIRWPDSSVGGAGRCPVSHAMTSSSLQLGRPREKNLDAGGQVERSLPHGVAAAAWPKHRSTGVDAS